MTEIRKISFEELPRLKEIWTNVFGDEDRYLDLFFSEFSAVLDCFIAECDGEAVGSACVLNIFTLKNGDSAIPCPYIYAVGVLPEHRSKGIGKELVLKCRDYCSEKYGVSCLVPAEAGLFDYYERTADYVPAFNVEEVELEREGAVRAKISTISPETYGELREKLLEDRPHMEISPAGLRFMAALCELNYMDTCGLYLLEAETSYAIAFCDDDSGVMFLREIIASDGNERGFAAALHWHFDYPNGRYRAPANEKHPESAKAFGMLSKQISGGPFYFGPAFD